MDASSSAVRRLYSAALLVFLVTIVIGILNGLDLWDPPRTLLLTHVHAGTLGWITLAVFGVSVQVFGRAGDDRSADTLSWVLIGATALYLLAFATTTSLLRPLAGGLMLAAILHGFSWATVRRASAPGNGHALRIYQGCAIRAAPRISSGMRNFTPKPWLSDQVSHSLPELFTVSFPEPHAKCTFWEVW